MTDAVTFCFLSQALIAPVAVFGPPLELSTRIRTGDIAIDLYRPVDLQAWWLASDLGRAAFHLLARGVPPFLVGALAFHLRSPDSVPGALAVAASVALALLVSFAIRYLLALTSFWLLDDRGVNLVAFTCASFFAGLLVPLVLFPGALGTLADALPWAAILQVPADVWLGQHHGTDLPATLAFQAAWAVLLLSGMGIFAAIFVLGAAFQFIANDAVELQSSFTHGGRLLTQYPMSIYGREAVRALTFLLPMAFINWQPALYVLGRPDPTGQPSFLRFCSPLVALALLAAAGLAWRAGLRRYRSTGS